MAMYTRTAAGVSYVLMKEDVGDFITNIDPDRTPLATRLGKAGMNGSPHFVNEDTLAAQNADNAQRETADAPAVSDTTPTQRYTYAQIFAKTAKCGGSLEARETHGTGSQLAYQVAKKMKEVKRDQEAAIISSNATVAPAGNTTAGKLAGMMNLISTNLDSTTTTFTSAETFNALLQQTYDAGGEPTEVFVGGARKRDISQYWTTNVSRYDTTRRTELTEVVDVFLSDFGRMDINYHWMMPTTDCLILQMDMWRLASPNGRTWFIKDLPENGDYEAKEILAECTLECRSEKANASFSALT